MQTVPRRRPAARSALGVFRARCELAASALLFGAMATTMLAASPAAAQSRSTAFPALPPPAANAPRLAPPFPAFSAASSPGLSVAGETTIDRRIEGLRAQLAITPPQMPLWTAFAHAVREDAQSATALSAQRAAAIPAMSAADNLHDYARVAHAYADNLERLAAAFDRLYTRLSAAQRRIADAVFRQPLSPAADPPGAKCWKWRARSRMMAPFIREEK